jgi:hypothetical protein
MDWIQFAVFFGGIAGLFFWSRSESRADNRQMLSMMQGMQNTISAIKDEMKDFHGRLERQDAEFKSHFYYHNAYEERNK